jgi:DNA adenine methylase
MSSPSSPLRYPGGKQVLSDSLATLINLNDLEGCTYLEPYAGGAGAALTLLFGEYVERIHLNDADPAIFALWMSVLNRTDSFLRRVRDVPLSIEQWLRQREIYQNPNKYSQFDLGFAAFFLNRCNRSGIIANAGVIGGLNQTGNWKIDARFNRSELAARISKIALYSDRISIHNLDALDFLEKFANPPSTRHQNFVYLDPPYFEKGSQLYLSYYTASDHVALAKYLHKKTQFTWVLTYDDTEYIRALYSKLRILPLGIQYSAGPCRSGREILILKPGVAAPGSWRESGVLAA